ncbi:response regulator transcription factor [Algiphilus sp.]|uniref:response regulator transcription factor n=1 Tax=Algiphilus sp. TaxID=1872431 RepID=UPI003B528928
MKQLLIVEDDTRVARFLERGLSAEGYTCTLVHHGTRGLEMARHGAFDLILLDRMLPGHDGVAICRALRKAQIDTPILMLTALDEVDDRVEGLRTGADDYLGKPFDFEELLARLEALARRSGDYRDDNDVLTHGPLQLDIPALALSCRGQPVSLTTTEMALIRLLMSQPKRVYSRERILNAVWGQTEDPMTNIVDVYIGRLRRKLDSKDAPSLIETVRGAGYRLASVDEG